MKLTFLKLAATVLVPAALLVITSCSSTPKYEGKVETREQAPTPAGFGGVAAENSTNTSAIVVSFDAARPQLVLKFPDGSVKTFETGVDASPANPVKTGDKVAVTMAQDYAVFLGTNSVPRAYRPSASSIRTPPGITPLVKSVGNRSYTGRITATDAWQGKATLQLADGETKTVKVPESINLANVKIGDHVSVQVSEATLILLVK